jgi:hypothetical protein
MRAYVHINVPGGLRLSSVRLLVASYIALPGQSVSVGGGGEAVFVDCCTSDGSQFQTHIQDGDLADVRTADTLF